jgi:CubicO group peptidase (beta-lactamase class C family)
MFKKINPFFSGIAILIVIGVIMLLPLDKLITEQDFSSFQVEYIILAIKMFLIFKVLHTLILMKTKMNYITFLAAIFLCLNSFGQINQEKVTQIDSLFTPWNTANHPGGTVLISIKGETVFSKAYGLASLEYNIPNTLNTRFNIGSLSKQFTAMGIVLLEEQNKLSFDDDIRKYIPELAPYDKTITIRHLLHHTSGIRDIHGLLGLAGWRPADLETNEDVYRVFKNQKDLNFNPGDELSYSNTGYIFLARIIEKVSGLTFEQWMKQNIFDPLGMKNTYVETSMTE